MIRDVLRMGDERLLRRSVEVERLGSAAITFWSASAARTKSTWREPGG